MKTIGLNKHECVRNLRLYRDKMEKILSLIEDKLPLPEANKARVELLLKDLNQGLKNLSPGSSGHTLLLYLEHDPQHVQK